MMSLRVWWIPQIPMEPFHVEVESIEEGVKILDVLADYDRFQYENQIKPDYCNTGGLQMFEDGEWTDWCDDETGEDDPRAFVDEGELKPPFDASSLKIRPFQEG